VPKKATRGRRTKNDAGSKAPKVYEHKEENLLLRLDFRQGPTLYTQILNRDPAAMPSPAGRMLGA